MVAIIDLKWIRETTRPDRERRTAQAGPGSRLTTTNGAAPSHPRARVVPASDLRDHDSGSSKNITGSGVASGWRIEAHIWCGLRAQ